MKLEKNETGKAFRWELRGQQRGPVEEVEAGRSSDQIDEVACGNGPRTFMQTRPSTEASTTEKGQELLPRIGE